MNFMDIKSNVLFLLKKLLINDIVMH